MLVSIAITHFGRFAQTGRAANKRLIDMFPKRAGMDEHFIIEPGRQEARQFAIDRADVKFQTGPMVLRFSHKTVE